MADSGTSVGGVKATVDAKRARSTDDRELLEWLTNDLFGRAHELALVVMERQIDRDQLGSSSDLVMVTCTTSEAAAGFADASFDRVYLCWTINRADSARHLEHARRLLRPGGTIVAVSHRGDFSFAPLPTGGGDVVLKRALTAAGFEEPRLAQHLTSHVVVTGRRKPSARNAE
jgi:SAM-dependent methyltransferase